MAFNFMLPLRIVQSIFAIMVLGLEAYGMATLLPALPGLEGLKLTRFSSGSGLVV